MSSTAGHSSSSFYLVLHSLTVVQEALLTCGSFIVVDRILNAYRVRSSSQNQALPACRNASDERKASAITVNAGLAGSELGKTELSTIHKFEMSWLRPNGSTTESSGWVPMRQVPIVCADLSNVQMSEAPTACQACVIQSAAWADIFFSFFP